MNQDNMPAEISSVVHDIADRFTPDRIYLFSNKRGEKGKTSGFKLCVVVDCEDRGETERQIYLDIDSEVPFDVVLYSPQEWEELCARRGSFAQKIAATGVLLHG